MDPEPLLSSGTCLLGIRTSPPSPSGSTWRSIHRNRA
nr:MAG TPA: hypothetical protein [Caudoviricetes sp.]